MATGSNPQPSLRSGDFFYNETDKKLYIGDNATTGGVAYPEAGSIDADDLAQDAVTADKIANDAVGIDQLSATGTPSSSTYLRGDNTWAEVTGSGGGSGNPYDFGTITTPSTAFCISFGSITAPAGAFDAGAIA